MNDEDIKVYWHSTAHIMAQAVQELFPDVKLGMGPAIEDGFYYDFDIKKPFTPSDITKIERKMSEIIKRDIPFVREEINKDEARLILKEGITKFDKISHHSYDPTVYYFYKFHKYKKTPYKFLCIAVKYLNGTGYIITAYFDIRIK